MVFSPLANLCLSVCLYLLSIYLPIHVHIFERDYICIIRYNISYVIFDFVFGLTK